MFIVGNILMGLSYVLDTVLFLLMWIIIIRVVISWVNPDPWNPIVQFLSRVTDPILITIRNRIGFASAGGFDLSPIIAILIITFLQYAVVNNIEGIAMRLQAGM
ncbi:MAG: YggT family protein [Nitrospirae bacterium]|nr:YggT family protein [Nitrospirota bacterium]